MANVWEKKRASRGVEKRRTCRDKTTMGRLTSRLSEDAGGGLPAGGEALLPLVHLMDQVIRGF